MLYSGGQPTVAGVTLPVGLASNGFYVALELTAAYSSGNLYEEIKTVQVRIRGCPYYSMSVGSTN